MTPIAEMIREMHLAGVDMDTILLAVEAVEKASRPQKSADVSADSRREKDRIRKQIERENLRKSADVRGNPQMSENASSLKEVRLEENKEEKKEAPQRTVRGSRMLPDWKPDPDEWIATVELIGGQRAQSELLKFRDYWIALPGAKGLKADWPATWRNWIRRITETTGATNGNRPHSTNGKPAGGTFFDGLRSLAADIAGDDPAPGHAAPEVPLGRFNIDG